MLGFFTQAIEDVIDVTTSVLTLGEYGELSQDNVLRLIDSGMTVAMLSDATGVAVDVIQDVLDDA